MALVKIIRDDITGIMVDGFLPDLNSLKSVAIQLKESKRLSYYDNRQVTTFLRLLRDNKLSNNSLYHHFDIIKDAIIYGNCPIVSAVKGNDSWKIRCLQKAYAIGKNRFSMEGKTRKWLGKIKVKEIYNILKQEFDNIRENEPNKHYLQNIILFQNISRYPCSIKDGCYPRWISQMHFDVKPIETYVDFSSFQKAWSTILEQKINRYKSRCNSVY